MRPAPWFALLALALAAHGALAAGLPRKATLGVVVAPVPDSLAAAARLAPGQGALVRGVAPGYRADRTPLRAGDVVLTFDGDSVTVPTLIAHVVARPAGSKVTLRVARGGRVLTLAATLQERARDPGTAAYSVVYDDVVSNGHRMRTLVTHPRAPGRHPAFFFIQGYSPISYDFPLDGPGLDAPVLKAMADSGWVTMRVDKPGVGDSEGGPFAAVDFTTELDIYRQALRALRALPDVDTTNVFLFGHSMGGAFGPLVADEIPVRGIVLYGVASRTWHEYFLDVTRYQGLLAGHSYARVDQDVREASRALEYVFQDHLSPDDVKRLHPELATAVDSTFPGGSFNGKSAEFWGQLERTNFADAWTRVNTHVYALHGASDFVTYDVDHRLIAEIVNAAHPGWGKWDRVPASDHLFMSWATEAESQQHFGQGTFNPAFIGMMKAWIAEVMRGDAAAAR